MSEFSHKFVCPWVYLHTLMLLLLFLYIIFAVQHAETAVHWILLRDLKSNGMFNVKFIELYVFSCFSVVKNFEKKFYFPFVFVFFCVCVFSRNLIFWVNRLQPVWAIQVMLLAILGHKSNCSPWAERVIQP